MLSAVALASDSVAQVGGGLRGSVTLGTMQAQGMRRVSTARLIAAFSVTIPACRSAHGTWAAPPRWRVRSWRTGSTWGFCRSSRRRPAGLELTPLAREPMFLACAPGHPLAGAASLSLAELAAERFVDMPEGWGVRMATDRVFAAAGIARTVSFRAQRLRQRDRFRPRGPGRGAAARADGGDRARGAPDPDRRRRRRASTSTWPSRPVVGAPPRRRRSAPRSARSSEHDARRAAAATAYRRRCRRCGCAAIRRPGSWRCPPGCRCC